MLSNASPNKRQNGTCLHFSVSASCVVSCVERALRPVHTQRVRPNVAYYICMMQCNKWKQLSPRRVFTQCNTGSAVQHCAGGDSHFFLRCDASCVLCGWEVLLPWRVCCKWRQSDVFAAGRYQKRFFWPRSTFERHFGVVYVPSLLWSMLSRTDPLPSPPTLGRPRRPDTDKRTSLTHCSI